MRIPAAVATILEGLEAAGFQAYIVGGCVRDALLGMEPHDFDVTTDAAPQQVEQVFRAFTVLETGLKHGTVTVLSPEGEDGARVPVEVTTFRTEGSYSDGRHPDAVSFTKRIGEDLARRDFTMNAIAYSPVRGFADPFDGRADVKAGLIRAVGEAAARFREDGLRILRAIRFAAVLPGFRIEEETARAAKETRALLSRISAERVAQELAKLLCGSQVVPVLAAFPEILFQVIPELRPAFGFSQNNPHHVYSVYEHSILSCGYVPPAFHLRLAALLHDSGKPYCYAEDEEGIGHFHGHAARSAAIAEAVTSRLKLDRCTCERVRLLVEMHDIRWNGTVPMVKRLLARTGEEAFFELLALLRADTKAQAPAESARLADYAEMERLAREILVQEQCFSRRQLAVNGSDLLALGFPAGPELGAILDELVDRVIDGRLPNEQEALLAYVRNRLAQSE
ncbi:MAG: HD domain-containing protein [Firmicutes bacterium]|nr:HD domain-containing protein [Bacillota bacterium]